MPTTGGAVLRRALGRHRRRLAIGTLGLSVHQAREALVPVAIGVTIDRAVATGSLPALALCLSGTALLFVVLSQAYRHGSRAVVAAWYAETHQLRVEVAARVLDPHGLRGAPSTGELLSIATSDCERTGRVSEAAALLVGGGTALLVAGASLLLVDVPLGLGVLVGVPLLAGALHLLAPRITRRTAAQQADVAQATGLATDLLLGLTVLRGLSAEDAAGERYRAASGTALRSTLRAAGAVGAYRAVTALGSGLSLVAVAGVAGALALRGEMSVGELVTVVGLAQFLAEPVGLLGFAGQVLAEARASAARVAGVLALPAVHAPGAAPAAGPGLLELRDARAGSLAGLGLRVEPGGVLGVVAADPRDADSLVGLLAGRHAAQQGAVLLDGVDTARLDPAAVRRAVLVEPHTVVLFETTLRAAVDPAGAADDRRVHAALRAAGAADVPGPTGLDSPVGDRGRSLSGGQRQRVGLARALLRDPAVLVLHDPTTAVDAVTEETIAAGLLDLRGPHRSTVLVTTSPALLGRCDRVVVVAGGRVTAEGTHATLAQDPGYAAAVLR